jgi:hypothetical protein
MEDPLHPTLRRQTSKALDSILLLGAMISIWGGIAWLIIVAVVDLVQH